MVLRRSVVNRISPYWVLDRQTGTEVLVTEKNFMDYRDSVRFITLDKPVLAEDTNPVEKAVKAAPKKKAAKKKAAK